MLILSNQHFQPVEALRVPLQKRVILVTGATGRTGRACVEALLESNDYEKNVIEVRVLVRNAEKAKDLKEKGVTAVVGDYEDQDSLKAAFQGVNACFLVCKNLVDQAALETNVIEVAEASSSCSYLVKIGTSSATTASAGCYTSLDSIIQYGQSHAEVESRLEKCKMLNYTVLRPNYFMQNFLADFFGTLRRKMVVYPHQESKANIVDIRDVAAVAAKLLLLDDEAIQKHNTKIYDVCGPEALSIKDIAEVYSKTLKTPIQHVECDADAYKASMEKFGIPEWLAASVTKTHSIFWKEGAFNYKSSPEVEQLLQRPLRTFESWVSETAATVKYDDE